MSDSFHVCSFIEVDVYHKIVETIVNPLSKRLCGSTDVLIMPGNNCSSWIPNQTLQEGMDVLIFTETISENLTNKTQEKSSEFETVL